MDSETFNDNAEIGAATALDAHGHAALLLVESLIHGLIARDVITVADAVEIVDVACEVTVDYVADRGGAAATLRRSVGLLNAVSASLRRDIPQE